MKIKNLFKDSTLNNLDTIVRWDLNQVIKNETVSQHSFWVALYSTILAEEIFYEKNCKDSISFKLSVTRYALFHDLDEAFSGDIHHSVKNNPLNGTEIKKQIKIYVDNCIKEKFKENNNISKMFLEYLICDDDDYKTVKNIVKICDWLSFLKYLENEKSLGNKNLDKTVEYCLIGIKEQINITKEQLKKVSSVINVNFEILDNLI